MVSGLWYCALGIMAQLSGSHFSKESVEYYEKKECINENLYHKWSERNSKGNEDARSQQYSASMISRVKAVTQNKHFPCKYLLFNFT